jgi:hypothetical protein
MTARNTNASAIDFRLRPIPSVLVTETVTPLAAIVSNIRTSNGIMLETSGSSSVKRIAVKSSTAEIAATPVSRAGLFQLSLDISVE